ncbi:MAG: ATP-binding cassette domain-containing protein [Spirochaetes bacterium]|nr:ATP-binding cassette domain-containing protein [Spirochaetota bacterium]MBU1080544.1 ATP-binding cassette domain-containing protein [Spirochaetota bacterium]
MRLLSLGSVSKYYSSTATLAVDGASFELRPGEVHALVGENGAGKSTLAKIMCGFESPDSGRIELRGEGLSFGSHRDAERAGIGFVPQYSMLAPGLTAAENVALGHEPRMLGVFADRRRAAYDFSILADRYGFVVDPDAVVSTLSAAERREVEILRALSRGGDVLVLDEPTSILGERETSALFALIGRLKDAGAGIVYISHRAREILELADRISVMRSGRLESTVAASDVDERSLADMIMGGASIPAGERGGQEPGAAMLELRGVSLGGRGADRLDGADLVVRSGEIVAVIALGGNGLEALEAVACGEAEPDSGEALVRGRPVRSYARRELVSGVMAYIPTDREGRGLCAKASVALNAVARRLPSYSFREFAAGEAPLADAGAILSAFNVRNWPRRRIDTLSGGNRQRVVVARELERQASLVIAANPAQGLDGSSRAALFSRLSEMRAAGSAVLILSSDPEDASAVADRSFALYRGRLKAVGPADESAIAAALTGAAP